MPKEYFYLEQVPGGAPLDVSYMNQGHVLGPRSRFGVDAGEFILFFTDGGYHILLEKEKWFAASRHIIKELLSSDERYERWKRHAASWLPQVLAEAEQYKRLDVHSLPDETIFTLFRESCLFDLQNTVNNTEVNITNYATNDVVKALHEVLRRHFESPAAISSLLLVPTGQSPLQEYDEAVSRLARECVKRAIAPDDDSLRTGILRLLDEYDWLDAGFTNPPKTRESVLDDIARAIPLEADPALVRRQTQEKKKLLARKAELLAEVLAKANDDERRAVLFALENAAIGRKLLDATIKFNFYRRKVFDETARRLGVPSLTLRQLQLSEIEPAFAGQALDVALAQQRMACAVCVLTAEGIRIETDATRWKAILEASRQDVDYKGEIACSKGKVRGKARIVHTTAEMHKVRKGDILVSSRTYPDLLPAMKIAGAIVAELGGLLSHAAIVSRELGIPCLVGVKNITTKVRDGDTIEVDTDEGKVILLR